MRSVYAKALATLGVLGFSLGLGSAGATSKVPPHVNTVTGGDPHGVTLSAAITYADNILWANTVLWNNVAAWNAAYRAPSYSPPQQHFSGGGSIDTGACGAEAPPGFPAWIIQRESRGDPGAVNPSSGAMGCAQILPSHFSAGGGCAGMSYAQCWATLWDNGAGASNWAG